MRKDQLKQFETWFYDYVNSFYGDDAYVNANLKLKEDHTRRVCDETMYLVESLSLSENDGLIARAIALFHDVGRFPQFIRYRTYNDHRSTKHSLLSLEILRENNVLDELDPREKEIIETAVELHGTKELPEDLNGDIVLFAKLIRDADKIDIYRIAVNYYKRYYQDPENFTLEVEFPDEPRCSPAIIQAVSDGKLFDYSGLKTLNDAKLLQLGWVYDVNFPQSLIKIRQQQYLERIAATLPQSDDIKNLVEHIFRYVDDRIDQAG